MEAKNTPRPSIVAYFKMASPIIFFHEKSIETEIL